MSKHQNSGGNALGRIFLGSAIMVLMAGAPIFLQSAWAADAGYIKVITAHGALDGASKDPAHLNWITISSVVAADLNGDAMADREASSPSVSEHAIVSPRDPASGLPTGKAATVASSTSSAGAGKSASDSWSAPTSKEAIGSQSSGAGAGKVTAPRDMATGMASGKRMHKPFTITKEIDKASPLLAQACASGQHFSEVDVQLASGEKYTLTDVMVSSVQKASGGDRPMESISFTYQKIEMSR